MPDPAFLDKRIEELELTERLKNALINNGHVTYRTVVPLTEAEFLSYDNVGRKSLNELKEDLANAGWPLGTEAQAEQPTQAPLSSVIANSATGELATTNVATRRRDLVNDFSALLKGSANNQKMGDVVLKLLEHQFLKMKMLVEAAKN